MTTIQNTSRTNVLYAWNGVIDPNAPYRTWSFPPQEASTHWSLPPGEKRFVDVNTLETDYYFYASNVQQSDPQTGETSYPAYFWYGRIPSVIDVDVDPGAQQVIARAAPQGSFGPVVRPNQKTLTSAQQQKFTAAINALNNATIDPGVLGNGRYADLVVNHGGNANNLQHDMHGMMDHTVSPYGIQRFLAWHRIYLLMFDQALKEVDPTVSLPYWDWVEDRAIPTWLQGLKPTVVIPGPASIGTVLVVRNAGDLKTLPSPTNIVDVLSNRDFTNFTSVQPNVPGPPSPAGAGSYGGGLEGIHNSVHMWFPDSSMNDLPKAPADPIFWMHHANLDRIWQIWQWANPYQYPQLGPPGQLDGGGLPARTMDPWTPPAVPVSYDEESTRSTIKLGYVYEQYPPSPPRGPGGG